MTKKHNIIKVASKGVGVILLKKTLKIIKILHEIVALKINDINRYVLAK